MIDSLIKTLVVCFAYCLKGDKSNINSITCSSSSSFYKNGALHGALIRNGLMTSRIWHTINFCVILNKYGLSQYFNYDYDALLSLMWLYWTMEHYSCQFNLSEVITVNNHIIFPYFLIIILLFSYKMFILLRIFCVIISLSMVIYKLYRTYHFHQNLNNSLIKDNNKRPHIIFLTRNIEIEDDDELKKLVESLPLNFFFYSSFSSYGVMLIPQILSVFHKVYTLTPLWVNYIYNNNNAMSDKASSGISLGRKTTAFLIRFIHSMIVMYIVVK